jgi:uncharacterized protein (DUF2267 family)
VVVAARVARAVAEFGNTAFGSNTTADQNAVLAELLEVSNVVNDKYQEWYHNQATPTSNDDEALQRSANRTNELLDPSNAEIEDAVRSALVDTVRARSRRLARVAR